MRRAVLDEAPFVAVLVVLAVGFTYLGLFPEHWLRGVSIVAVGFALAGVLRAVLADRRAGLLSVRGRRFDTVCYLAAGISVLGFAMVLPR